jgi:hypothetical protein
MGVTLTISESIRKIRSGITDALQDALTEHGEYGVQPVGDSTLMLYDKNGKCQGFVLVFPSIEALDKEEEDESV